MAVTKRYETRYTIKRVISGFTHQETEKLESVVMNTQKSLEQFRVGLKNIEHEFIAEFHKAGRTLTSNDIKWNRDKPLISIPIANIELAIRYQGKEFCTTLSREQVVDSWERIDSVGVIACVRDAVVELTT